MKKKNTQSIEQVATTIVAMWQRVMEDPNAKASDQLAAAEAMMNIVFGPFANWDLETRIMELEKKVAELRQNRQWKQSKKK